MYLKSIEVYGFKSFANKIIFEFKHGITGIVGPNGSGKSNVADAVRWVLGEQSAKQLRGAKMEDVIFSGTENRKPLGFAYVAITLDNSDHSLDIEYEEVTVARRVYRSGESEYLINGSSCRLKDVQQLFFDTGIGKEGYSIIGQGQVDRILSGKPEERRELLDEAAGIVKYKKNKAATEKTLEQEREKLERVTDILSELEQQVKPLEQQSIVAKEYLQLKEQLKNLDSNAFLLEIDEMKQEQKQLEEKITVVTDQMNATNEGFHTTKNEYEQLETKLNEMNQSLDAIKNSISEAKVTREKKEGEVKVLNEQINTAKTTDTHIQNRLNQLNTSLEEISKEKQELQEKKTEINEKLDEMDSKTDSLEENLNQHNQRLETIAKEIEAEKEAMMSQLNEDSNVKAKMERYEGLTEHINLRKVELNQRLLQLRSEEESNERKKTQEERMLQEIEEKEKKQNQKVYELKEQLAQNQEHQQINTTKLDTARQEVLRSKSKLETIKNMEERYEGYGNSIKKVMEQKKSNAGIIGVVADIIKVKKEYELAIETALGGSIQNIVTDNEQTAKAMISFLKEHKYGRATFLPLTSITNKNVFYNEKALKEEGVIGLASSLVETKEQFKPLTEYLLGRTVVVDHIDNGIKLSKKYQYSLRIVTIEGESFNPGGSMTGGAYKNTSNLLGRRREIKDLQESIQQLEQVVESSKQALIQLKNEKTQLNIMLEEENKKIQEIQLNKHTIVLELNQVKEKQTQLEANLAKLKGENNDLVKQMEEIETVKQDLVENRAKISENQEASQEKIAKLNETLEKEKQNYSKGNQTLSEMKFAFQGLNQENDYLLANLKRIAKEEEKFIEEKEELLKQNQGAKNEILEIEKNITQMKEQIETLSNQIKEQTATLEAKLAEKEKVTSQHKEFLTKREELQQQLGKLDKENFRLQAQLEKTNQIIEQTSSYMWEEYQMTYQGAKEFRDETLVSLPQVKKSIGICKADIKKLGDVNVNAIEDYKVVAERYEFLSTQRDDILKAEENLITLIEELDVAMRNQFNEKFAEIQRMFDKVFKELFGGGKGSLELTDSEDVLEAGIRIIAQPPGKKLQNMMQLSGGEKAFTAIALLFAIQSLKPSPFCLLDEIEAALDDSNVKRFAQYLHKLTKDTQFIVITHRRGTMTSADVLYGITMQEKGVSTLVSVNLIEDDLSQ